MSDLGTFSGGGTPTSSNEKFWNGNIPWISSSDLEEDNILKINVNRFITQDAIEKSSTKLCKAPSVLIVSRVGVGKVALSLNDICTSQDFTNISELKCNQLYLAFQLSKVMKKAANEVQGTSIKGISSSEIKSKKIYLPSISEQEKISSFFEKIDKRIQTQKKIIEDLIILKSSTAQNIFNQVFKFKDSEENDFPNWEIKKLGDVCEIKRGASPRPISDSKWFDEESPIGWVRISDVTKSNKYLEKTEQYLSNAGVSKSRLVKKGNMIMSICATIGKPIYTNLDVCIHDGFVVFENLTLDKEFLYYYLDFIQLNWYKYGQPGIQVNLNSEIVNNESVVVPVIEEQIKIASFLSKFDEKINLETDMLTQYENQKKYLLQNLFV
ncbi:type I restriction endonuclease subunit S [Elizabethkingia anophelis]|nr:type I restriction endonuclease subunit S [Elizabethkingia anophelis]